MAITNPDTALIDADDFKLYKQGMAGTGRDDHIDQLCEAASSWVSDYCGRRFATTTHTEYYSGRDRRRLFLNHWPVTSVTSVNIDVRGAATQWGSATALTEDTDSVAGTFVIHAGESGWGCLERLSGYLWTKGTRNIKVVYIAGYAVGAIPAKVMQAALIHASIRWDHSERKTDAAASQSLPLGAGSTSFIEHDVPPDIKALLLPYKSRSDLP